MGEARVEEALGFIRVGNADAEKQFGEDGADVEAFAEALNALVGQLLVGPDHSFGGRSTFVLF